MFGGNSCPIARWAGKGNVALRSQNGGKRIIVVDTSHLQFSKYVVKPARAADCRRLAESGNCQPRNRSVRDIVGASNIAHRLAGIAATEGFLDLTRCQLRRSTHLYPQPRLLHPVAPDMPKQRLTERFRSRAEGLVNSMRQIGIPY